MKEHTLKPVARESAAGNTVADLEKSPLYAWKSQTLSVDASQSFRSIRYSMDSNPSAGWTLVGPVGSLFKKAVTLANDTVKTHPLVQFTRTVDVGTAVTVMLGPSSEDSPEFAEWRESQESAACGTQGAFIQSEILGYALSPSTPIVQQATVPLFSASVHNSKGEALNQPLTTSPSVYRDLTAGIATTFDLTGPAKGLGVPIAQITPVFEIEVDHVDGVVVATVRVGEQGPGPGDLVVPTGAHSLVRFSATPGADFQFSDVVFMSTPTPVAPPTPVPGFVKTLQTATEILVDDGAPPGTYDYTLTIAPVDGGTLRLDPRIRNRASVD